MGGLVAKALEESSQALFNRQGAVAYSVILRDQKIDDLEQEIDRLCLEFLCAPATSSRLASFRLRHYQDQPRAGTNWRLCCKHCSEALILNSMDIISITATFGSSLRLLQKCWITL